MFLLLPSTTAIFPSMDSSYSILISAGMFIVLARIAVCELEEPCLVTNASTLLLSICTVSLGARSSATTITGSDASSSPSHGRKVHVPDVPKYLLHQPLLLSYNHHPSVRTLMTEVIGLLLQPHILRLHTLCG